MRFCSVKLILITGFCIIASCSSDKTDESKARMYTTGVQGFDNSKACQELLQEYLSERDGGFKKKLADNFKKEEIGFSTAFPLFIEHCSPCHHKGGNAPFKLDDYPSIRKKAAVVEEALESKIMPPFMSDPAYSDIINVPHLHDSDRYKMLNWVRNGAKNNAKFNIQKQPQPYEVSDLTGSVAYTCNEHTINSNSDSYQCFKIDLKLDSGRFVKAIKFNSTNKASIHHIMVYLDTAGVLDNSPDCWNCMEDGIVNKLVPIDSWSKGMISYTLAENFGFYFPKGSKLLFQTHYGDEGFKGQKEQTIVNVFYCEGPKRVIKYENINNFDISIKANTVKTESIAYKITSDISLLSCGPHFHHLAKKIEIFAITSSNKKIPILKINNWDYLWQGNYMLKTILKIPANSVLYLNAVFDNTSKNPKQPNNPIRDVTYKTYSNEEMMVLSLHFTEYKKGDEFLKPYKIFH